MVLSQTFRPKALVTMFVDFRALIEGEPSYDPEHDGREAEAGTEGRLQRPAVLEVRLILQAVTWYLRYPLSYRDLEEMFAERGFAVDHSTINRWVLTYAPLIEKRLRRFRKPHCGSIRIDGTKHLAFDSSTAPVLRSSV